MTSPTPRRTRSPWKWPSRSLIALSSSRSIISRQKPRPDRALRAISRSTAAKKKVRLNRPVSGSTVDSRIAASRARRCSRAMTIADVGEQDERGQVDPDRRDRRRAERARPASRRRPPGRSRALATAASATVIARRDDERRAADDQREGEEERAVDAAGQERRAGSRTVIATRALDDELGRPERVAAAAGRGRRARTARRRRAGRRSPAGSPATGRSPRRSSVVARRKTQATIRTIRSYVRVGDAVVGSPAPIEPADDRRPRRRAGSARRPARRRAPAGSRRPSIGGMTMTPSRTRFAATATTMRIRTGVDRHARPRSPV